MRFLLTRDCTAAYNMALDEAIFNCKMGDFKAPTVLRVYSWKNPTISLGYFQKVNEVLNLKKCNELGVDWLRRPTGGGAILHHSDVTFSFVIDEDNSLLNIISSYHKINKAVIAGLQFLGFKPETVSGNIPKSKHPLCFLAKAETDILLDKKKVSGSAQRRKNGVIMQHGSIKINIEEGLLKAISKADVNDVSSQMTSLEQAMGKSFSFYEVSGALVKGFENEFGQVAHKDFPTESETVLARELIETKYSNDRWNYRK